MKLPILSAKDLCSFLEQEGFVMIRQKGSHRFYRHEDDRTTIVPVHSGRTIGRGLLRVILDQIDMSREEFFKKWKK